MFERNKIELVRFRHDVAAAAASAQLDAGRLQVLLNTVFDGIALFDVDLRLVQ